ncbi:hypothetical protein NDU88_007998 [Pleurodeles waltl]|uniref:Uncharacterized protein n=1 Tax=Pleurodeles waltl TaxID=8319 RepID=A0AAV7U2B6_PLEWA|nr:hypothetical protein NDU88_007998 [Pleurodeles waltl]
MTTTAPYSITRNSSHFREFRVSDDDDGKAQPSAEQKSLNEDTGESTEAALPNGEGPLRAQDAQEEKGHGMESSRPMRASRKPKRLIEEL